MDEGAINTIDMRSVVRRSLLHAQRPSALLSGVTVVTIKKLVSERRVNNFDFRHY